MSITRNRLYLAVGAAVVLVGGGLAATFGFGDTVQAAPAAAAAEVDVAPVIARSITEWQSYSGRLEAVDRVEVRPLVSGRITAVHFKDGAVVAKGAPLFTIDPQPYQAAVDQAAAQVAAAEARAAYASTNAARADRLITTNAIAKRDHDESVNQSREASANLKAARAALAAARVDLAHTRILAPMSGRVSRAELTEGNVVTAGAGAQLLTTVVSISPIYASFNVDEQAYLRFLRAKDAGGVPVALGLADEAGYSRTGVIDSVDNQLDTASGTIRVRAKFENEDAKLLPGLYARVKVGGGSPHPAILVDDNAIGTDQAKKFVLLADAQNKVHYREIVPGDLHEGMRIVRSGLKAGDRIVVNGIQRVRANDTINPKPVAMAAPQRNP